MKTINYVIKVLSDKYREQKIILFLDEIQPHKEIDDINFDMTDLLISCRNVDLLLAINPQEKCEKNKGKFQVNPPKNDNILAKQLLNRHRNNYENGVFLEHYKSVSETYRGILNPFKDICLNKELLPKGKLPVWIQRGEEVSDLKILEFIEKGNLIEKNEHVTILSDLPVQSENIAQWCLKNGFRYINDAFPWGIEDEVVIIFNSSPGPEGLSRSRINLIMVTVEGCVIK